MTPSTVACNDLLADPYCTWMCQVLEVRPFPQSTPTHLGVTRVTVPDATGWTACPSGR